MGMTDENRRDIVLYRIERAFLSLHEAKANYEMGFYEVTANRLYYAAHYAVTALLIANQITARSHDGSISQFGMNFVKTGIFPKEMGKLINTLFNIRQTGDYSDRFYMQQDDVESYFEPTEDFVKKVTDLAKTTIS